MDPLALVMAMLFGVALLFGAAWAIYVLLKRASADGGAVDGDPTEIATRIMAEVNGFRGSRDQDSPPWDGVNRLGPPTVNGGWLAWAFWFSSRSGERAKRAQVKKSGKP
ncbi:MAG: hypothetical protein WEE53_13365 [Acidimicrobiia bacterium]